ncbi:MAG: cyclase family protein [Synoicihabitans sp.]
MPHIVDLTLTVTPGVRGVDTEPAFTKAKDGWNASTWHLYSHSCTHMDAQVHFEAGPGTIDATPLSSCFGPAWIIRVLPCEPQRVLTVADLGDVADKFQPGESLIFHTGWSAHVNNRELYRDQMPRIGETLARWMVEQQVRLLGVEPPSVADVNDLAEVTLIHEILLAGKINIVEGLTNLESLTSDRVFFGATPLKLHQSDGSPVRAFAFEGVDPNLLA